MEITKKISLTDVNSYHKYGEQYIFSQPFLLLFIDMAETDLGNTVKTKFYSIFFLFSKNFHKISRLLLYKPLCFHLWKSY
jgi:hypothetical protein